MGFSWSTRRRHRLDRYPADRARQHWVVAAVMLACLGTACGTRHAETETPPATETTLRVENQAFLDMNVYVVRSGQRVRLGTVSGNSTRVFTLSQALVGLGGELQFLADPVGSPRIALSESIVVTPGDTVTLVIPPTVR